MLYLITPNPEMEHIEALVSECGDESYLYLSRLLKRFLDIGSFTVDVETIKKTCHLNKRKAKRLLPHLKQALLKSVEVLEKNSQTFAKHLEKFGESFDKLLQNNSETLVKLSESFGKLDTSNPHGSTREESSNKLSNNKQASMPMREEYKKYLIQSGNTNLQNIGWVEGFINRCITEIRRVRQDLTDADMYSCWCETCDKASEKGITAPKWFETTFMGVMQNFDALKPNKATGRLPLPKQEEYKAGVAKF